MATAKAASKLTSKYQATIPAPVRERLDLEQGDSVLFEIRDDGTVELRRATPMDVEYLQAVEDGLSEWLTREDDQAYGDL